MESIHKCLQCNSMQPLVNKPMNAVYVKTSLGIYWDIENCPVGTRNARIAVKLIRNFIDARHPECGYPKEFIVVADVKRMDSQVCDSLDRNGVTLVHVNGSAKNAADDKLREFMNVFVDDFGAGAVLVVITGDINFVRTIHKARSKDVIVVLIHGLNTSEDLKDAANETYLYDDVIRGADIITQNDIQLSPAYLQILNLPIEVEIKDMTKQLSHLSDNCGGKIKFVGDGEAVIRFGCKDDAQRAAQRMAGVDCFGHKIDVKLIDSMTPKITLADKETIELSNDMQVNGNTVALTNISDKVMDNQLVGSAISPNGGQNVLTDTTEDILTQPDVNPNPFGTKPIDNKRKSLDTIAKDSNKENKTLNMGAVDEKYGNKSVIKGLSIKRNRNLLQKVRQLVNDWKDNEIKSQFISYVKRNAKHCGKLLVVKAIDPEASLALVNGARKYLKPESGIQWVHYKAKQSQDLQMQTEVIINDKIILTNKSVKQMLVNNDCKSIIMGLDTNGATDVTKLLRKLVMNWMDNKIHSNFITNVKVFSNFETVIDGNNNCPSLLVTASSAGNSKALVAGAQRHLSDQNISWINYEQSN